MTGPRYGINSVLWPRPSDMGRAVLAAICLGLLACADHAAPASVTLPPACRLTASMRGEDVPSCLETAGLISVSSRKGADSVIGRAAALAREWQRDTATYERGSLVVRSIQHVADLYARGMLADSARFNRIIDHVAVTAEYAEGLVPVAGSHLWPKRTPHLAWHYFAGVGVYMQPVETVQATIWIRPTSSSSTDSLLALGEALWKYAVWHTAAGRRFPIWEYYLPLVQYGIEMVPPWQSGMAQGEALIVFTELYRRTQSSLWRERARQTFESFQVRWDDGGVQIADTVGGLWWEEYHPAVRVWNGSMLALIAVGEYADASHDASATQMYLRGLARAERDTPLYDTGTWTRYALVGPTNGQFYHSFHIQIADALYAQSGAAWAKTTADRWRSYPVPPGTRP